MSYNHDKKVYEGYIYLITNNINNKKYVGLTTQTIEQRWNQHCHPSEQGVTLIDKKIKQYGKENFSVECIVKTFDSEYEELRQTLGKLEQYYIRYYNSLISTFGGDGYNVDKGGQSNNIFGKPIDVYNMDGELVAVYPSKTAVAIAYDINPKQVYDICYGIQKNYRCLCVFRFHNEPFDKYDVVSKYYKEIYQFTLDGYLINKYYSCDEITKKYGLTFIGEILDDPYRIAGGYWWSTSNVFNYKGEKQKPTKRINQFDLWGNLIIKHNSIAQCSKITGYSAKCIINNCNGNTATVNQYLFRYEDDSYNKYHNKYRLEIIQMLLTYYYPVKQYDKIGNYIAIHKNISEAVDSKISKKSILDCCFHRRDTVIGYIWRFKFDVFDKSQILEEKRMRHKNYRFKPIDIFNLNYTYLKTVYSIKEFILFFGKYNKGSLSKALKTNGHLYGYLVKRHEDPETND